jgi:hypothetical protein
MTDYEKLMLNEAKEDLTEVVKRLRAMQVEIVTLEATVALSLKELEAIRAE